MVPPMAILVCHIYADGTSWPDATKLRMRLWRTALAAYNECCMRSLMDTRPQWGEGALHRRPVGGAIGTPIVKQANHGPLSSSSGYSCKA